MYLSQQKPDSGQATKQQNKENRSTKEQDYPSNAPNANGHKMFEYWMDNAHTLHGNAQGVTEGQINPIQKTENEEKLEEKEPAQMKSESVAPTNYDLMTPTVVPSKRQRQIAQRKEQEADIRQNKPIGMNKNTYLNLSSPQESSKIVAQAKFMQYKKSQVKQLKRNKQASIQFNGKVKQFERTIIQNKIAYGSDNYNTLLGNYFPDMAGEQTSSPNNTVSQKKEASTLEASNSGVENINSENKTGLPDKLKSGVEQLSGIDVSDIRVHHNSDEPTQMQAHAFAQGTDIHVAPGQEQHLPHEAWHVIQQKQGRVQPTAQMKGGVNVNDDTQLEQEADIMGNKALQMKTNNDSSGISATSMHMDKSNKMERPIQSKSSSDIIQLEISPNAIIELGKKIGLAVADIMSLISEGIIYAWIWINAKVKKVSLQQDIWTLVKVWDIAPSLSVNEILLIGKVLVATDLSNSIINNIRTITDLVIHNASEAERQAVLNNNGLQALIRTTGNGAVLMSALLEGSQKWKNPTSNDFFDYFVTNTGNGQLPNTATMNCWESVLYAEYLAKQLTAEEIRTFYTSAMAASDVNAEVWRLLGYHTGLAQYQAGINMPTAGNRIFYVPQGAPYPSHVALSLGSNNAMSLWHSPNNIDSIQRIQVNDLHVPNDTIYFGG